MSRYESSNIAENLSLINTRIRNLTSREMTLVAVSKFMPAKRILEAISCGHRVFGENYVQEAKSKIDELLSLGAVKESFDFNFIGSLQSNKAKEAVGLFSLIQSVDRLKLAELIANRASQLGIRQKILLQVNISREASKSGVFPEDLLELLRACRSFDSLDVQGLMTIGRVFEADLIIDQRVEEFKEMNLLLEQSRVLCPTIKELSMGMSEDFELAINNNATIVRIGTAIFGSRG